MKSLDIVKIVFFYLLVGLIVLLSPLGPIPSYIIIIGLSLLFTLTSGIKVRPGNPLAGVVTGTLAMIAVFLIILAAGGAAVTGLKANVATALLGGAVIQVFVATGEELSFRQYLFADLARLAGPKAAAALSSAGFAAMHLPSMFLLQATLEESIIALTSIFLASLLLTLLFARWGLLAAMGFHFTWNFLQYNVFGFSYMDSALAVTKTGSQLLNGGDFGPEASIPGLIVITATLLGLWYFCGRPKQQEISRN